jgi:hypothetical protein
MQSAGRIVLSLLLLLGGAPSTHSQTESRQQLAEKAADNIIRRFYENLDFADVYRACYVKNPEIRKAEVEIVMGNMVMQGDHQARPEQLKARSIDFESFERSYLAMSNFHWVAAAGQTYQGDRKKFLNESVEIWEKYITPLNKETAWPILTSKELEEKLTASFTALASFFRGYVVRANLDTPEFWSREQQVRESRPPDSIERLKKLFAPAGMSNNTDVYIVRRSKFYLYMVEENGEFRMFSWNHRIQD